MKTAVIKNMVIGVGMGIGKVTCNGLGIVKRNRKICHGFSLMEAVVAMAIIAVAAAGALSCEFFVAKHVRQAKADMIAARTAQLLLEDWKANKGSEDYDPNSLGLNFTNNLGNGRFMAIVDFLPMYFTLDARDIDMSVNPPLREITVTAQWRNDFSQQQPGDGDSRLDLTTYCQ